MWVQVASFAALFVSICGLCLLACRFQANWLDATKENTLLRERAALQGAELRRLAALCRNQSRALRVDDRADTHHWPDAKPAPVQWGPPEVNAFRPQPLSDSDGFAGPP